MGVRGLQSFLKNNPQVSQVVDLSNIKLVIDSNNLQCQLYKDFCLEDTANFRCDLYGGNMVDYAEFIKLFFNNLKLCKIDVILVIDGSVIGNKTKESQLASKDRTVYNRAIQRFQSAKLVTEDTRGQDHFQLSSSVGSVFRSVTRELSLEKVQTPFEADTHIAQLANKHNCPVLTNDSDFIIYSLPVGFAMIDLFDWTKPKKRSDGSHAIRCTMFSQAKLISCVPGLMKETLPLISVLLGNDFIDAGTFEGFLSQLPRRFEETSLRAETFAHRRIVGLLCFLRHKTLESAVEEVIRCFIPRDQLKVSSTIRYFLNSYNQDDEESMKKELYEIYPESGDKSVPQNSSDLMPATYISCLQKRHNIDPIILDIIFHNPHYRYCHFDDFNLNSSSFVEYRIYSLLAALLKPRSYSNLTTYRKQVESERDAFICYDRVGQEYRKVLVRPMENLDGFGPLDDLNCYSMINLDQETNNKILMSAFRFTKEEYELIKDTLSNVFAENYLLESTTCFILVKYIALETKLCPKPQFVDALLMVLFYYAAINNQLNEKSFKDQSEMGKLLLQLRPHALKGNGLKYQPSESLFRRIVHFINQLKCAYRVYELARGLLDKDSKHFQPLYQRFFNATLIFRITKLLRLQELKMEVLCLGLPALLDLSVTLKTLVNCDLSK